MEEFKIGGRVTLVDNEKYRIVDIIEYNGKKYFFCCTEKKPITPKIFERLEFSGKTFISFVENPEIIRKVTEKMVEN